MGYPALLVILMVIISYIYWQRMTAYKTTPPEIHTEWWGEGKTGKSDTTVKPFAIDITKEEKVLLLLVLHGWAECLRNLYEYLPLLTKPRQGQDFVFEVIAPTLPGFGFSQGTSKPGFGSLQHAVLFDTMMQQLGYTNYYVQGGDFGGQIATFMAQLYPNRVQGLHITMCLVPFSPWTSLQHIIGSIFPSLIVEKHEEKMIYPLYEYFNFIIQNSGYFHEQSTKPDTIALLFKFLQLVQDFVTRYTLPLFL